MPAVGLMAMSNIFRLIWGQEYQSHPINLEVCLLHSERCRETLTTDNRNPEVDGSGCQPHHFLWPCYCSAQRQPDCWRKSSSISRLPDRPREIGSSCSIRIFIFFFMVWLVIKGKRDGGSRRSRVVRILPTPMCGHRPCVKERYRPMRVCNVLIQAVERIAVSSHVCVQLAGRKDALCAKGEPACAKAYSKVDYAFGSVLLTVTKQLCFWREFEWNAFTLRKI